MQREVTRTKAKLINNKSKQKSHDNYCNKEIVGSDDKEGEW